MSFDPLPHYVLASACIVCAVLANLLVFPKGLSEVLRLRGVAWPMTVALASALFPAFAGAAPARVAYGLAIAGGLILLRWIRHMRELDRELSDARARRTPGS